MISCSSYSHSIFRNWPDLPNIYLIKTINKNYRKRGLICSTLTMKIPEQRYWSRSGAFIVNVGHISQLFLVLELLTLIRLTFAGDDWNYKIVTCFASNTLSIHVLEIRNKTPVPPFQTNQPLVSFWCLYCLLWTYSTPCFSASIINFE